MSLIKDLLMMAAGIAADVAVDRAERRHPYARLGYFLFWLAVALVVAWFLLQDRPV